MNQTSQREAASIPDGDFPPAPWRLRGYGYQTLLPVAVSAARPFVPAGARIVSVWPGKTLASVYFASYEDGSTLIYHEIVIAAGLVWAGGRLGFALPRLYVDSAESYAGGHAIWGAPKELATFTVEQHGSEEEIVVRQAGEQIMALRFGKPRWAIPAWVPLPSFGVRGGDLLFYVGKLSAQLAFVPSRVSVPSGSPFAPLRLDGPALGFAYRNLDLRVPLPRTVGRAA